MSLIVNCTQIAHSEHAPTCASHSLAYVYVFVVQEVVTRKSPDILPRLAPPQHESTTEPVNRRYSMLRKHIYGPAGEYRSHCWKPPR